MLISLVKYIFPGALQLNGLMGPMKTMKTDIQPIKINICYYITSDNLFSDWLTSLVTFFDNIQLLPALAVNIIIVHTRGVVFPEDLLFSRNNTPRVNNYDVHCKCKQ